MLSDKVSILCRDSVLFRSTRRFPGEYADTLAAKSDLDLNDQAEQKVQFIVKPGSFLPLIIVFQSLLEIY